MFQIQKLCHLSSRYKQQNQFRDYFRFISHFNCFVEAVRERMHLFFNDLMIRSMVLVDRPIVSASRAMEMLLSAIMDFNTAVSFRDRSSGIMLETSF